MRIRIAIIILVMILVSCAPVSTYAPTKPIATEMVVSTKVYTSTDTPSRTSTARPIATPTFVPTYTPATPSGNSETYKLQEWSADKADQLINQVSSNLKTIENEPIYQSVYGQSYYMQRYKFLVLAEKEALLRFPNVSQATYWRWDLCYNLAVATFYGGSDAPELPCYAKLIEEGLNSRQTDLLNLASWFAAHEKRFSSSISITSFSPPLGYTSSYIITLEDSAIWLLLEKDRKFKALGLMSNMFYFREAGVKFQLLDLTGDNYPELVLYEYISSCCGSVSRQYIYELSSGIPKQLYFENLRGISANVVSDYDSYITSLDVNTESPGLLFKSHYGDPLIQPCDFRKDEKYYWINNQFELVDTWLGVEKPSQYDRKPDFCKFVIDTAKEQGELDIAVKTIGDSDVSYPDVTEDQVLYRLGEYRARLGDVKKAKEFFTKAIDIQPRSNKSDPKWARAAQIFLDNDQKESDYYKICSKVTQCNMSEALQQLITKINSGSFITAIDLFRAAGVSIKSNGVADFDSDGKVEQWLVAQYPNRAAREFWILVKNNKKLYGLFVAKIPTNKPELKEFEGTNTYGLTTSDGENLFSLEELSFSGQPYVLTHTVIQNNDAFLGNDYLENSLFEKSLDEISEGLLNGEDPRRIREMLISLNQAKTFNCKISNRCDELYYLLGLSSELAGDNQAAVDSYVQLWQEYPSSFYTIMARSKLEPRP